MSPKGDLWSTVRKTSPIYETPHITTSSIWTIKGTMAKADRLKRMHLVYDKHAHTRCHYLQLDWYCTKAWTLTLLTAHRWRNSIGVRMQMAGGMGERYGEWVGLSFVRSQCISGAWTAHTNHEGSALTPTVRVPSQSPAPGMGEG